MLVINIVLECGAVNNGMVDTHIECNLLKREDVNEAETQIAKSIEGMLETYIRALPAKIKNFKKI